MKGWVKLLIFTSVWAQILLISAPVVFAQKIPVRYKPPKNTARSVGAAATTRIPYVVNPRLPVATQQRVAAFSGAVVDRNISNRVVEAAHQVTNHTPANPISGPITAHIPSNTVTPEQAPVLDSGTNLTGVEILNAYFPTWRQELGGMFTPEQLDAVERTFAATDEWLFVRDEDGELQIRNKDEWNYEERFLTILQDNGVSFTEKQIKQLTGGKGIKGFTLQRCFTLQNLLGFVKARQGHTPRRSIKENGHRFNLTELRKQAQEGDRHSAELAAELTLGLNVETALYSWSTDLPEYKVLNVLYNANRNQAVSKTPQQVIAAFKRWIIEHPGTSPRMNIRENGKDLTLSELRNRAKAGDEEAAELAAELEVGKAIHNALTNWSEDLPERKIVQELYDASRNTQTPTQFVAVYQKYLAEHDNQSPRMGIKGPDGKLLRLSELRERARQGDEEAARLAAELEVGQGLNSALNSWPENLPERKIVESLYKASRNRAASRSTDQLYQDLVAHIRDYGHYPMQAESSLYKNIHRRLHYYQSTMVDGKYVDPYLQKIYELKTAIQNAPEGKFTLTPDGQGGYILEIEEPAAQEADVTAPHPIEEPAPAAPSPHTIRLRINEETKNLVLATRDQAALERREFPGWLHSMHSAENFTQIVDANTFDALHVLNRAINFDYRNGQNRRAVTYLLETVNNYVGLLGEQPELGTFYKLIYRGTVEPGMLPAAANFHVVAETQGLSWDGALAPQIEKVNRAYAQAVKRGETPSVYLEGDDELVTALGIEGRVDIQVVKQDFENVIAALLPPGYTVRMGVHELGISGRDLTKFRKGYVHIHLENASTLADEEGLQIDHSISLDVKVGRFAGWWDPHTREFSPYSDSKIAERYLTLFGSFLDQEAKDKLGELAQ